MSVYRYYIPGKGPAEVTTDYLRSCGLADRLWDCLDELQSANIHQVHANGPDGSSGSFVVPPRADGTKPATQFWKPGRMQSHKSHHGGYWIVWDTEEPPTPDGLRRKRIVDGYEFGEGWIAPRIRQGTMACVPCAYSQLNGTLTKEPTEDYQDIWEESGDWARKVFGAVFGDSGVKFVEPEGLTVGEEFVIATRAMWVNHRVSSEELSLLKVLTDDTMSMIIHVALETAWLIEGMDRIGKKKDLEALRAVLDNS